jgi:hypothetical protein
VWGALVCGGLASTFAVAAGCSTESEYEVLPPGPRDLLADELAATICNGAANCCTDLGFDQPGDSCRSSMRNAVMASIITAEDQLRELVPSEHDSCIAAFQAAIDGAASCDHLPAPLELEGRCPTIFTPIPEGAGQPGDPCTGTFDCASPTEPGERACIQVTATTSACAWLVDRAVGEPCTPSGGTIPVCPEGLTCAPPDATGTPVCAEVPGPNQYCLEGKDTCVEGYVCVEDTAHALRCFKEIGLGEDCSQRPKGCADGLYCAVDSTCKMLPDPCASGDCPTLVLQNVCR